MKRKNIVIKALTCGLASLAMTACTDIWDNHYQPKPELNATETLWDLIQADPELNQFEAYVEATGYAEVLKQNRFYTIWAPVDGLEFYTNHSLEGISDSLLNVYKLEFVENHIADYNHTASGLMSNNIVKMLNGKYNKFEGNTDNYTFKGAPIKETNIAAKNGLLHKTDGYAVFTANIWEQLAKVDSISLLNDFLKSYDEIIFDMNNSVEGPMVGGQVTYLDSVIKEHNAWFDRFGFVNREDSSYIMFAPTNKAWREMYEKAKTYFVYDDKNVYKDSLQDVMAKDFMCRYLVFSNTIQKSPVDSLVGYCSTYQDGYYLVDRKTFKDEELANLYNNVVEQQELSNGTLYIVDSYNYPTTIWHDTLRVEGESLRSVDEGAMVSEFTTAIRSIENPVQDSTMVYKQIHGGKKGLIGIYKPSTPTGNPKLTYTIKNVLSAKYRIKVVFVPRKAINNRDTISLPNKFNAQLYYREAKGTKSKVVSLGQNLLNDPTKVDTMTLVDSKSGVDYFEFPVNEYNLGANDETFLQLVLTGKVGSKESAEFDREFRIDQVFLEPVIE